MEIHVPEVGESISEATLIKWYAKDGASVHKDDLLCELETDKINLEIQAEVDGVLHIGTPEETTVRIGEVIGRIEEGAEAEAPKDQPSKGKTEAGEKEKAPKAAPESTKPESEAEAPVNPAARRLAEEKGIDLAEVKGSGRDGRILRDDVLTRAERPTPAEKKAPQVAAPEERQTPDDPRSRRVRMSAIRKRIAERLLQARQQTAMLTTFNEVDMARLMDLRRRYKAPFEKRHGVSLGLMSFFVKATILALKEFPEVNARIDGGDIVYQDFYDIGIAVGAEKGLMVPVLRDADQMTVATIEKTIRDYAERAQASKLQLSELEGGTFTITNGGVYGSMMSTPILNPPQSAILGMHAIQKRAVVVEDEIAVRPMMYLALSYDHRIIDGRQAVGFLKAIKAALEAPEDLLSDL